MTDKIPKQLFVVTRGSTVASVASGFLHPDDANSKAGQKRMETQLNWARDNAYPEYKKIEELKKLTPAGYISAWCWKQVLHKDTFKIVEVYAWRGHDKIVLGEIVVQHCTGVIWDNEPVEGFKIVDTVSRHSTSNKLWIVSDPRGGTFEITTDYFEQLIMSTTIVKGAIQGKCVWVKNKHLKVVE